MLIYKAEAGLEDVIKSNKSISFVVQQTDASLSHSRYADNITTANIDLSSINIDIPDTQDLFYVQSVLVSTVWNKNDDVFHPLETWAARKTPVHKPTNIEHDEKQVVGHMTSQWAINADGDIIADDIVADELPQYFHLCNGGVIYRQWRDKEFASKVDTLIEDIQAGNKFVSMECLFTGFDYALSKDSGIEVVSRNEETAFLTKHLRAYGGDGEFEGMKVARVLRNIVFSGKGYVDKPANPDSIIFHDDDNFNFVKADKKSGVYIKCNSKENEMSLELVEKQLDETKTQLAEQIKINKKLAEDISAAGLQKFESQISDLEKTVASLTEEKEAVEKKLAEAEDTIACRCKDLDSIKAERDKLAKDFDVLKRDIISAKRMNRLISGGMSETEAADVDKDFEGLSDEQFEKVAQALLADVKKPEDTSGTKTPAADKTKTTEDEVENTDSEVVDNAEPEDASASVGSVENEGDEVEETRAALVNHLSTTVFKFDDKKENS